MPTDETDSRLFTFFFAATTSFFAAGALRFREAVVIPMRKA